MGFRCGGRWFWFCFGGRRIGFGNGDGRGSAGKGWFGRWRSEVFAYLRF